MTPQDELDRNNPLRNFHFTNAPADSPFARELDSETFQISPENRSLPQVRKEALNEATRLFQLKFKLPLILQQASNTHVIDLTLPAVFNHRMVADSPEAIESFAKSVVRICEITNNHFPSKNKISILQDFIPETFRYYESVPLAEVSAEAEKLTADLSTEFVKLQPSLAGTPSYVFYKLFEELNSVGKEIPGYQPFQHGTMLAKIILLGDSEYLSENEISINSSLRTFVELFPSFQIDRDLPLIIPIVEAGQHLVDFGSLILGMRRVSQNIPDFDPNQQIPEIADSLIKIVSHKHDPKLYAYDPVINGSDWLQTDLGKYLKLHSQSFSVSKLKSIERLASEVREMDIDPIFILRNVLPVVVAEAPQLELDTNLGLIKYATEKLVLKLKEDGINPATKFCSAGLDFLGTDVKKLKNITELESFSNILAMVKDAFNDDETLAARAIFLLSLAIDNQHYLSILERTNYLRAGILVKCIKSPTMMSLFLDQNILPGTIRSSVEELLREHF